MLLNQCLAISLSPIQLNDDGTNGGEIRNYARLRGREQTAQQQPIILFQKLVEENTKHWAYRSTDLGVNSRSGLVQEVTDDELTRASNESVTLDDAVKRIQLAGFVLPTWLLLSGSYNDLHCLKTSWSNGYLKSPTGYKIETIGNIRSVNVDYFGAANNQDNDQQADVTEIKQEVSSQQQAKQSKLEAAILSSLSELSISCNSGVHICNLIEGLNSKYSRLSVDSPSTPAVEFIDCAIEGLVRGGQVKVRPSSRERDMGSNSGGLLLERASRSACRQSVYADQVLELASPSTNSRRSDGSWSHNQAHPGTKSKSTTLDSGIQSWLMVNRGGSNMSPTSNQTNTNEDEQLQRVSRPARRINQEATTVEQVIVEQQRRGFSLTRSFSFRPKKHLEKHQTIAAECRWTAKPTTNGKQANNLTSLFRSKSMRIISSGKGDRFSSSATASKATVATASQGNDANNNCDLMAKRNCSSKNQHGITIDYLATAQPHKRSMSLRRNSLLNFNAAEQREQDPSSSGKLVLFLRKLFSGRRSRSAAPPMVRHHNQQQQRQRDISIDQQVYSSSSETARKPSAHENQNLVQLRRNQTMTAAARTDYLLSHSRPTAARKPSAHNNSVASSTSPTVSSSTSPNSSGSNSLIEILDCSRVVNNSHRPLRREAIDPSSNLNRAQWRLIKRSESNLSRDSDASCSSIKSTASQQLRRHLNEACKRHRKCTNQRERDFLDSINVLRQASRHALQNSRSSLKSRQAKSTGTKSATSEDTASSFGSNSTREEQQLSPKGNELFATRYNAHQEEQYDFGAAALSTNGENVQNVYHLQPEQPELDLIYQKQQHHSSSALAVPTEGLATDHNHHHNKIDGHQMDRICGPGDPTSTSGGSCCLCNSYMEAAARLSSCPLVAACYPPPTTAQCCCFTCSSSLVSQQQTNKLTTSATANHNPLMTTTSGSPGADFCCPLWRPFMYNYPPYSHFCNQQPLQQQHQQQQIVDVASNGQQQSYSRHQQQQHQHNTTIDLKIEIGADFNKQQQVKLSERRTDGSSSKRKQRKTRQQHRQITFEQPEGEVCSGDADEYAEAEAADSLEVSELTTTASSNNDSSLTSCSSDGTEATSCLSSDESMTSMMMNSDNIIKMDSLQRVANTTQSTGCRDATTFGSSLDGAASDSLNLKQDQATSGSNRDSLQISDDDEGEHEESITTDQSL